MISITKRALGYAGMSVIVGWHTLAMLVAPMPEGSAAVQAARSVMQPYLSLFRLDNKWNFFAPAVGRHAQFRYVVKDRAGKDHLFIPMEEARRSAWSYFAWREFKYFFEGVMEAPDQRGYLAAALLCQQHAGLDPVSISLEQVRELGFSKDDYLAGHRPLEKEFVSVDVLAKIPC
jgi:hypothetical protein